MKKQEFIKEVKAFIELAKWAGLLIGSFAVLVHFMYF